jgi:hypothetical protein
MQFKCYRYLNRGLNHLRGVADAKLFVLDPNPTFKNLQIRSLEFRIRQKVSDSSLERSLPVHHSVSTYHNPVPGIKYRYVKPKDTHHSLDSSLLAEADVHVGLLVSVPH